MTYFNSGMIKSLDPSFKNEIHFLTIRNIFCLSPLPNVISSIRAVSVPQCMNEQKKSHRHVPLEAKYLVPLEMVENIPMSW